MRVTPGEIDEHGRGKRGHGRQELQHNVSLSDQTYQHERRPDWGTDLTRFFMLTSSQLEGKTEVQKTYIRPNIINSFSLWRINAIMSCCVSGWYRSNSDIIAAFVLPTATSLDTQITITAIIFYHFSGLLGFISVKLHFVSTTRQSADLWEQRP